MAIFHLHIKHIGRSSGASAVCASAYRSGSKLSEFSSEDGTVAKIKTYNFTNKEGVFFSHIFTPENAAAWMMDRESLWNNIQNKFDRRVNSVFAQEINIALPIELNLQENILLVKEFVAKSLVSEGIIVDANIHMDNPSNPHAHLMLTTREIIIDQDGIQTFGKKVRYWDRRDFLVDIRRDWEFYVNKALATKGIDERVSSLSNNYLGIDTIPTIKEGSGRYIDKSERIERNNRIKKENFDKIKQDPSILIDIISSKQSLFTRRDLEKALSKYNNKCDIELVNKALKSQRVECTSIRDPIGRVLYKDIFRSNLEKDFVSLINNIKNEGFDKHSLGITEQDIVTTSLTREQEYGICKALNSGMVTIIDGLPGVGKTDMLKGIADTFRKYGRKVLASAVSSSASRHMSSVLGCKAENLTKLRFTIENKQISDFDLDIKLGSSVSSNFAFKRDVIDSNTVLIIDEATMVDLAEMQFFLSLIYSKGAKIILVGDKNQISSIRLKGAYEKLLDYFEPISIKNVIRQNKLSHRIATSNIAERKLEDVLETYWENFVFERSFEVAIARLSADYAQKALENPQEYLLVLASSRERVLSLNRSIREFLKYSGQINNKEYILEIKSGENLINKNFSVGDKIIFTRNNGNLGILNNDKGVIKSIRNKKVKVKLDQDHSILGIKLSKYIYFDNNIFKDFDLGYASTIHKAQGLTCDYTYCIFDHNINYNSFNVLATRHRKDLFIYFADDMLNESFAMAKKNYSHFSFNNDQIRKRAVLSKVSSIENTLFEEDYLKIYEGKEDALDYYLDEQNYLLKHYTLNDSSIGKYNSNEFKKALHRRKILAKEIVENFDNYRTKLSVLKLPTENLYIHAGKSKRLFGDVKYQDIVEITPFKLLLGNIKRFRNIPKGILFKSQNDDILYKIYKNLDDIKNHIKENNSNIIELENEVFLDQQKLNGIEKTMLNAKSNIDRFFPIFLRNIYKDNTKIIEAKLSCLDQDFLSANILKKYQYLSHVGSLKGLGLLNFIPLSKDRYRALVNLISLPDKINQYLQNQHAINHNQLLRSKLNEKIIRNQSKIIDWQRNAYSKKDLAFLDQLSNLFNIKDYGSLAEELEFFLMQDVIKCKLSIYESRIQSIKGNSNAREIHRLDYNLSEYEIEAIFRKYAPKINPDGKIHIKGDHIISGSLTMNLKNGLWYRFSRSQGGNIDCFLKLSSGEYIGRKIIDRAKQSTKTRSLKTISWEPFNKIPKSAKKFNPEKDCMHYMRDGSIEGIYKYQNLQGDLLGYSVRISNKGKKMVVPYAYCRLGNKSSWRPKDFSKHEQYKPIYGLEKLLEKDKPILIVEGEKTADIASNHLPNFNVISWLGGTASVDKVDWAILKDRDIYIWPDNDYVGIEAAKKIILNLKNSSSNKVLVCINPSYLKFNEKVFSNIFSPKWDLADEKPKDLECVNYEDILFSAKRNLEGNNISLFSTDKEKRIYLQNKLLGIELSIKQVAEQALLEEKLYNIFNSYEAKEYLQYLNSKGIGGNCHEFLSVKNEFYKNILVSVGISEKISLEENNIKIISKLEDKYLSKIQNFAEHIPYVSKYGAASGNDNLYSIILRDIFFLQKNQNNCLLNSQKDLVAGKLKNIFCQIEPHNKNNNLYIANKAYMEICSSKFYEICLDKNNDRSIEFLDKKMDERFRRRESIMEIER